MIKTTFLKDKVTGYLLALVALFLWSIHAVAIRYLTFDLWISANFIAFTRLFLWGISLLLIWFIFLKKEFFEIINTEKIFKNKLFI